MPALKSKKKTKKSVANTQSSPAIGQTATTTNHVPIDLTADPNNNNGNSIANLFNENPSRLPNPNNVHQQAYQNQFGTDQFNNGYSEPNNFPMQTNNDPLSSEYAGSMINNNQNFMNPNHQNMYNQQYMRNNLQYPQNMRCV